MSGALTVPPGTRLRLLAAEVFPNPTRRDEVVWTVAVDRYAVDGAVWVRGHTCRIASAEADCGSGWCFEARVQAQAVLANLAGAR